MMKCPKCHSLDVTKSGVVKGRQRYRCKECRYNFTVSKAGKSIDNYYVIKALQLYLEGISYREIERILGISHVSVMNWVRKYHIKRPEEYGYHPTYQILSHSELAHFMQETANVKGAGMIITEVGDKFMVIRWERFKK